MVSPWSALERPPLRAAALRRALVEGTGAPTPWTDLWVKASTGSTNADVVAAARAGAPPGLVVTADEQTAGRGRLGRAWGTPPRAALAVSVLLRPSPVPAARWGWLPLLTGLAVLDAVNATGVDARLKWPNDVLVADRKLAGILAERVTGADHERAEGDGDGVVVGVGINVSLTPGELPVPTATSLLIEGVRQLDRDPLLRALLRGLGRRYVAWRAAGGNVAAIEVGGDGTREAYVRACSTLGRTVRVALPGGAVVTGRARDIDADGRLVLDPEGTDDLPGATGHAGSLLVASGDVLHVR